MTRAFARAGRTTTGGFAGGLVVGRLRERGYGWPEAGNRDGKAKKGAPNVPRAAGRHEVHLANWWTYAFDVNAAR